jgi:hypothetical protein
MNPRSLVSASNAMAREGLGEGIGRLPPSAGFALMIRFSVNWDFAHD